MKDNKIMIIIIINHKFIGKVKCLLLYYFYVIIAKGALVWPLKLNEQKREIVLMFERTLTPFYYIENVG